MAKKTVADIELSGKKVLVRVDFNVPLDETGDLADALRIQAALPTLEYILERGGALVLMSHLGRPKGKVVPELSLKPVAQRLSQDLGREVRLAPDCVGAEVEVLAAGLQSGEVLLLENLRFHAEEEDNSAAFARQLGQLGDVYVNDAFGAAHRAHAPTAAVTEYTSEAVSGFLMEREIRYLDETISHPQRPFVAVLGGAKVSGKIEVIDHLLAKVDALIIGGGMAYTFFKAMGLEIGDSLLEEDLVEVAQRVMQQAERVGVELLLPSDSVVADRFAADAQIEIVTRDAFAPGWMGLDIGPQTCKTFADKLGAARTIVWNGPMGVFELPPFAAGTRALGEAIARSTEQGAISVVGGGDTASALAQAGLSEKMTHISTGGGASLEAMAGRELPGVAVLAEK